MSRPKNPNLDYCPPEAFDSCNICDYTFKRRGFVVDEKDFADHKASCIARVDWRNLVDGQVDLPGLTDAIN